MMEIQLKLILIVCIVHPGLISLQSHHQKEITGRVKDENGVRGNFQNLLDSIAKNDAKKKEIYFEVLKQEVAKEQEAFDEMKGELRIAQNRNAYKKRNFYEKHDSDENVTRIKRLIKRVNINGSRQGPSLQHTFYKNGTFNGTEEEASRIYLFSTKAQKNVLNASYGLLLSQKNHLENVTKQFDIIDRKTNIYELKKLEAVIFSLEVVIAKELKSVRNKSENLEILTSEERVDPIEEISMVCMLSAWTQMLNLLGRIKVDDKAEGIERQMEEMAKTIDIASVELRLYEHVQEERLRQLNKMKPPD